MASTAPKQDKVRPPAKRSAKRSSRHGEPASPSHFGPIACTSAASALVQAYLAPDVAAPHAASIGGKKEGGNSSGGTSSASRANGGGSGDGDSCCFLHLSESRFDPVKRRFGGKSKPVSLFASSRHGAGGGKGTRLSFGPTAKVVATKEAMHAALHCRCVFVLLCEASSGGTAKVSSNTQGGTRSCSANPSTSRGKRVDTAHLVALSPDDPITALSVDSFPLVASSEVEGSSIGGSRGSTSGSVHSSNRRQQPSSAACTFPRAFDVMDGPVVVHRPAARQGDPWRGLEVYRPTQTEDRGEITWRGQRVTPPAVSQVTQGKGEVASAHGQGGIGGASGTGGNGTSFRLDLSVENFGEGTPPPSGDTPRSKKRAPGGSAACALLVCPPCDSYSACAVTDSSFCGRGLGGIASAGMDEGDVTAATAAILALPIVGAPAEGGGATGTGKYQSATQWTSLFLDREGRASLAPWRGLPSWWRNRLTCLCRAPAANTGIVSLASATSRIGGEGGLVVKPLPPTVYIGAAAAVEDKTGADVSTGGGTGGAGGALLELQGGGALSCARLLPAPAWAVTTAAVDDGQGVLVVLLSDMVGTALLLARDGSEFPIVEEYRGVAAAFAGDFLGNGREQVALLPTVSSAGSAGSATGGGGSGGRRASAVAATKAGAGGWEQLPLKALVKRALVTDCSCVWGNGRRDDVAALPGAGPIQVVGARPSGASGGGDRAVAVGGAAASEPSKGRKRQRIGEGNTNAGKCDRASGSTSVAAVGAAGSGTSKCAEGIDDDHRLDRLSTVVGVLRRRVRAEEARLLRLRQARVGKAAFVEAAKFTLTAQVGGGNATSRGSRGDTLKPFCPAVGAFEDGLVAHFADPSATSTPPPLLTTEDKSGAFSCLLQCALARVRFHAPSRTLCLDAHISNPVRESRGAPVEAVTATAVNVCLSVASACGHLKTRSAVCSRLRPGESATVRACVEVPPGLLAGDGGTGTGSRTEEAISLYTSCVWRVDDSGARDGLRGDSLATAGSEDGQASPCSVIFGRTRVSAQDMLGVGALASTAEAPLPSTPGALVKAPSQFSTSAVHSRGKGVVETKSFNAAAESAGVKHLGLFDVGTRLDLLLRSDTASLAALPQAVRTLSSVASLPEPWAGGAAISVTGCSESAAECTLRAGDSAGASAVLLRVAAAALPDGARASADHASGPGLELLAAASQALRDEMVALEAVARERRGIGGVASDGRKGGGRALEAALEVYTAAQMKSDVLAARLAGRVVAAREGGGEGYGGYTR